MTIVPASPLRSAVEDAMVPLVLFVPLAAWAPPIQPVLL